MMVGNRVRITEVDGNVGKRCPRGKWDRGADVWASRHLPESFVTR